MLLNSLNLPEVRWCHAQSAYSASKAGLNAMSEGLRRELKPFGIDVVIIAPGVFTRLWSMMARPRIEHPENGPQCQLRLSETLLKEAATPRQWPAG